MQIIEHNFQRVQQGILMKEKNAVENIERVLLDLYDETVLREVGVWVIIDVHRDLHLKYRGV